MLQAKFILQYTQFTLDVDLKLPGAGITAIFGRSGSGKTTLLRCIAGLEKATVAKLVMQGHVWQDEKVFLPTHKRPIGYVFQEASLFSHLSVQGNLNFSIKRAATTKTLVEKTIAFLGLDALLEKKPHQLSGGERQRVAIARALLIQPKLLLMDEPLASLDLQSRQEILPYLAQLCSEFELPILYVSHALDEVARLADYMVVLDAGRVQVTGAISEVLSRLDFSRQLGNDAGVVLEALTCDQDADYKLTQVDFSGGKLWLPNYHASMGQPVRLRILARDISLALSCPNDSSILNILQGTVAEVDKNAGDGAALISLDVGGKIFVARVTLRSVAHLELTPGKTVWLQIKSIAVIR